MLLQSTLLTSIGLELLTQNAQRHAGLAAIAIGAVGEQAAAPKASGHQVRINITLDQVAGCCNLRPSFLLVQIAAWVGRCGIKLQGAER